MSEKEEDDLGWPYKWWCQTSQSTLKNAEHELLSKLSSNYSTKYVNIGPNIVGKSDINVWTYSANEHLKDKTPIVLIHGFASGLALWSLNLDKLVESKEGPLYAIDLPGFARSSRPQFSNDASEAEEQYVAIIEAWRIQMNLDKLVLVGHSFGGFLSFAYTLRHPERVAHLICTDPWGFNNRPKRLSDIKHIPIHHRVAAHALNQIPLNPLWTIRFIGPLGPSIIQKIRADLIKNFTEYVDDARNKVANYIFHCNAQNPTGESAFYAMMDLFGWAKNPLCERIEMIESYIPMTLIYGERTWINHYPAEEIVRRRTNSYVKFHIVDSGHHIYADQTDVFNNFVINACKVIAKIPEK